MTGMNDKLSVAPGFDGPIKNRKCTDIIFFVAIICMWIAMTAVGIASVTEVGFLLIMLILMVELLVNLLALLIEL